MHAHLVFVTKYRRGVLTQGMLDDLRGIFGVVCKKFEADLIECKGEDDHVHLLVAYPPKVALSNLVNSLKGVSSRMLRKTHGKELKKRLWKNQLWSPSYYAGSVGGAPLSVIARYIEKQREPVA
jgi:putative transposase